MRPSGKAAIACAPGSAKPAPLSGSLKKKSGCHSAVTLGLLSFPFRVHSVIRMPHVRPKILVVNDDTASLTAISSVLSDGRHDHGFDLVLVDSGQKALREVLSADFAVIFLDVQMPGMDGYETAEAIRQRARSATIPIIFLTAYFADELDMRRAYDIGAVDFLMTPIIPQILLAKAKVFATLYLRNQMAQLQATELALQESKQLKINQALLLAVSERKEAQRESEAKDAFLAMLGHELRNPLSAITSAIEVINFPKTGSTQRLKATQIIRRQAQHLSSMVEEVMELSRVLSGKVTLSVQRCELSTVMSDIVARMRTQYQDRRFELQSNPAFVLCDTVRFQQMVEQLIENAVKYTAADGLICVSVSVSGGTAMVEISDTGAGIDPAILPRLFNTFAQGETSIDRRLGGLGVGLALVARLCEMHGGSVSARSAGLGMGSTFTLQLPSASGREVTQEQPGAMGATLRTSQ